LYRYYLNARVSMLADRLIPPERLQALVEEGTGESPVSTQSEAIDALLSEAGHDSILLEQGLLSQLLTDFLIVARPLTGGEREFMVYGIRWFELANLKALIRGKFSGLPEQDIREQLVNIDPFTTLPAEALLRTEDPAEMLRMLEATPYANLARQARRTYEEHKDLFSVEAAIDRRYFVGLLNRAKTVRQPERQAVLYLTGCLLDEFNILWLLRYRFSYALSPAETYYLLIGGGHHLSSERLMAISQLGSLEEVLNALPDRLKEILAGTNTITDVENRMEAHTRQEATQALHDFRHAIARTFAYLLLREMELRQLLAIAKGRRIGFAPALIRYAAGLSE